MSFKNYRSPTDPPTDMLRETRSRVSSDDVRSCELFGASICVTYAVLPFPVGSNPLSSPDCSPRSELTSENLKWLENVFRRTVGDNGEIRLRDFKNIVHSKNVRESSYDGII